MINLLPHDQKLLVLKEYKLRRIAVVFGSFLSVIILADVLLVPSFVLVFYKARVSSTTAAPVAATAQDATDQKAFQAQLQSDRQIIASVKSDKKMVPSKAISFILNNKKSDITILSINYSVTDTGYAVSVRGIASTRESLRNFSDALQNEEGVTSVKLPVSSFAENSNIGFSIDIKGISK